MSVHWRTTRSHRLANYNQYKFVFKKTSCCNILVPHPALHPGSEIGPSPLKTRSMDSPKLSGGRAQSRCGPARRSAEARGDVAVGYQKSSTVNRL